ncbi:putative odorant receptor 19b [Schistocerca gregaria]|uniref:putative odorant receptor 19b n=1 Tax=Schistocerca gregaria TaxID=7010 RepID=UPI00211E3DD9|nr:putative odorant receptor 19b [Schistocerca gregaria]
MSVRHAGQYENQLHHGNRLTPSANHLWTQNQLCTTLKSSENGDLVKCLASAPTISSTPLLLYCLGAHSVREQGESLSLAVYSCHWTDASTTFRRALLIVMSRAQRPYSLTAGGIYPTERSTFLSVKTILSFDLHRRT